MEIHVCDLCKKNSPDAEITYKYKAKRFCYWYVYDPWKKIELCEECLNKIIKAKEGMNESNSDNP